MAHSSNTMNTITFKHILIEHTLTFKLTWRSSNWEKDAKLNIGVKDKPSVDEITCSDHIKMVLYECLYSFCVNSSKTMSFFLLQSRNEIEYNLLPCSSHILQLMILFLPSIFLPLSFHSSICRFFVFCCCCCSHPIGYPTDIDIDKMKFTQYTYFVSYYAHQTVV